MKSYMIMTAQHFLIACFCFLMISHLCCAGDEGGVLNQIKQKVENVRKEAQAFRDQDFFNAMGNKQQQSTPLPGRKDSNAVSYNRLNLGFVHAFFASLSVIIVSELGDKTFFIAAIMAMRYSRVTVFAGAITALGAMTILSAFLGFATTVIPRSITYYVSSVLFAIFGLKMLKEGYYMSPDEGQEEYDEVQSDLRRRDEEMLLKSKSPYAEDPETGVIITPTSNANGCESLVMDWKNRLRRLAIVRWCRRIMIMCLSGIFLEAFTLTFLAEWGDRSQITTIILAAREDLVGVIVGGTLGHALCTGLAVLGGRIVAQKISVRTVTLVGGVVFLAFAVSAFFIGP